MKYLCLVFSVLVAGCATSPPAGVEYINPTEAEQSPTLRGIRGGLRETRPGSGIYKIALIVINTHESSCSFSLSVRDGDGSRSIWRSERLNAHVSDEKDSSEAEFDAATRVAAVNVKGLSATVVVDGEEFPIKLLEGHSVAWVVVLSEHGNNVSHFDLH